MKGSTYQISVKLLLSKYRINGDIEYAPFCFNSATKTVINSDKYDLEKSFQEILYRIDYWINEGSGWIFQSTEAQYVNNYIYSLLKGSTYIELPEKLKNPMKGLINIKNNDNKCFLWCHIRHLNLLKIHPERITKVDKKMINDLDYEGIKFPASKKDMKKIGRRNNICINVFCYENNLNYPVYVSDQKFGCNCMDLLLIRKENKSHYVYIKDFNRFMCNKTKNKNKKYFCKCCLQCFSSEKVLIEHQENYLIIDHKQRVKLKSGSISFKNYFKQLPVPFKIFADFECLLNAFPSKGVQSSDKNNDSYTEKYRDHIPCSFACKVVCIDCNKLSQKIVLYSEKNAVYRFIEAILKVYDYCKKIMKKHFNKNLIMSAEEEIFQLSNICWICDKLFDVGSYDSHNYRNK